MSTLHRAASVYKIVPGYLETHFSYNQSSIIKIFNRTHAIINAPNKLQANTTYKSFAQCITLTNPNLRKRGRNYDSFRLRSGRLLFDAGG